MKKLWRSILAVLAAATPLVVIPASPAHADYATERKRLGAQTWLPGDMEVSMTYLSNETHYDPTYGYSSLALFKARWEFDYDGTYNGALHLRGMGGDLRNMEFDVSTPDDVACNAIAGYAPNDIRDHLGVDVIESNLPGTVGTDWDYDTEAFDLCEDLYSPGFWIKDPENMSDTTTYWVEVYIYGLDTTPSTSLNYVWKAHANSEDHNAAGGFACSTGLNNCSFPDFTHTMIFTELDDVTEVELNHLDNQYDPWTATENACDVRYQDSCAEDTWFIQDPFNVIAPGYGTLAKVTGAPGGGRLSGDTNHALEIYVPGTYSQEAEPVVWLHQTVDNPYDLGSEQDKPLSVEFAIKCGAGTCAFRSEWLGIDDATSSLTELEEIGAGYTISASGDAGQWRHISTTSEIVEDDEFQYTHNEVAFRIGLKAGGTYIIDEAFFGGKTVFGQGAHTELTLATCGCIMNYFS